MESVNQLGPHEPSWFTATRRLGSVRRTSNIDSRWPDGLTGKVWLAGRARDLVTAPDGSCQVVGTGELDMEISAGREQHVAAITTSPLTAGSRALVGIPAAVGFRRKVAEAVPDHRESRSPLHLLLDDVPIAALIAAYAFNAEQVARLPQEGRSLYVADQCAGWSSGGTMMAAVRATGRPPRVAGPVAPALDADNDLMAWHQLPDMPALTVRRRRRLDVWREDHLLACSAMFRDSYMHQGGSETVVHEYELSARLADEKVVWVRARPRVLPWQECPMAAASASRIVGQPVSSLRSFVRAALRGPSTCTHLNDLLRSLDDVVALRRNLAQV
jgi:Protein of unknown function (DUF2889)